MSVTAERANSGDVIDIARALIAAPSPNLPGDERLVAGVIHETMERLGLPRARVIAQNPERPNLLSTIDFGPGGNHLVLCGHIDTKPIGDAKWSVDPYGAQIDGDRLYGLGSADMKAAIAAILAAARELIKDGTSSGKLSILLLADEEYGAKFGAEYVASTTHLAADGIVIGEPAGIQDDFDGLHLVSRGLARLRLTARARQGHSSLSGMMHERNAGVDAARAVIAFADQVHLAIPPNSDGLRDWETTINPALLYTGGVGYGVLPAHVGVENEVRLLPGMLRDEVEAAFRAVALRTAEQTGADLTVQIGETATDWIPATQLRSAHPLVAAAQRSSRAVLGDELPIAVFPGTTDATWFDSFQGIPCLPAFGPGLLGRCHAADEWVSIDAVRKSVDLYRHLAVDFCASTMLNGDQR